MNRILQAAIAIALAALAGVAAAQHQPSSTPPAPSAAPSTAQPAAQPQQAADRPILKLRLDELDSRPPVRFAPIKDDRRPEAQNLPELGKGRAGSSDSPSRAWDGMQPGDVIPKSGCEYC